MPRAVRFDRYGGTVVPTAVEVDRPVPARDEMPVHVVTSSVNPGETAICEGTPAAELGAGSDPQILAHLADVGQAHEQLAERHTRRKIILGVAS